MRPPTLGQFLLHSRSFLSIGSEACTCSCLGVPRPTRRAASTKVRRKVSALPKALEDAATGLKKAPLSRVDLNGLKVRKEKIGPPIVASTSSAPIEELEQEERKKKQRKAAGVRAKSVLEIKVRRWHEQFPGAVVLVQVGSFYESYFEQAPLLSKLLSIKLTTKAFSKERHPFCGFPLSQLSKHVSTVVEAGYKVVIIDEHRSLNPNKNGVEIDRKVKRIVTPGTGVDESFVKADETNFILALSLSESSKEQVGLAYRDVSTGASFSRLSTVDQLASDLAFINPSEVVIPRLPPAEAGSTLLYDLLKAQRGKWMVSSMPVSPVAAASRTGPEAAADRLLSSYLASAFIDAPPPASDPRHVDTSKLLMMDASTLQALEIRNATRGKGGLLSSIRRTVSPGGMRLLTDRICAPSTELDVINERLALVSFFSRLAFVRQDVQDLIKPLNDSMRLLQRLYLQRGSALDLLSLKRTIEAAESIRAALQLQLESAASLPEDERQAVEHILARLGEHKTIAADIEKAVDEEALMKRTAEAERRAELAESVGGEHADRVLNEDEELSTWSKGLWGKNEEWVIRPHFDTKLKGLHKTLAAHRVAAHDLERSLKERFASPTLELKVVPRIGPVLWMTRKHGYEKVEADGEPSLVGRTGSTRTYQLAEWANLSSNINKTIAKVHDMEAVVFQKLTERLLSQYQTLHATIEVIDELDVAAGFADLAQEMGFVRPTMRDSTDFHLVAGRHPSVELTLAGMNRIFTANDTSFSHPDAFVHLITGPNMAGKSTLLRQVALIAVLAQAGSYVPADEATLGIVDRIFTRIGAHDELDRDRSTFMVEMDETSNILRHATDKSLVLLDEVGRGTSPADGIAISFATLHHLVSVNRSRTLFATHFQELADHLGYNAATGRCALQGVECWCTSVEENEDSIIYRHKLQRGVNYDSHGLTVARLSRMPSSALKTAIEFKHHAATAQANNSKS